MWLQLAVGRTFLQTTMSHSVRRLLSEGPLVRLMREESFGYSMRGWKGDPGDFFAPTCEHFAILAERRDWLRQASGRYVALGSEAGPALQEMSRQPWAPFASEGAADTTALLLQAGREMEADFIILTPGDETGDWQVAAGVVCFPSNWNFAETLGRSIADIHGPVPGLNEALDSKIGRFLGRLAPGESWQRFNWGLSRSGRRNQHPELRRTRLDDLAELREVFWRVELQIFLRLPETAAILFGIRVASVPLRCFREEPEARRALEKQLETMPPAVRAYKGFARSHPALLASLRSMGS